MNTDDFSLEELDAQHTAELPGRNLMSGLGVQLGVLDLAGIEVYVGTDPLEVYLGVYV